MKDKKDISDLIRDNQHKLEEQPSPRTWKRLESKLDNRRSKGHTFLYRQIAMAAAVVALVAVISLITVLSDKNNSKFAEADKTAPVENWVVQDLETVFTDASTNVRLVVEFQKELKERYANPIEEGTQAKKLIASNNTFTGSVNRPERLAKEMLAMDENKNEVEEGIFSMEKNESKTLDVVPSESKLSKPSAKISNAKISNDAMKNSSILTQQMEWILGKWKENGSTSEWKKMNNYTLICEEFTLEEKQNIGLQLIDSKTKTAYALISEEENKKVFSNKNSDRIILEKINSNKFTLTFLPTQGIKKLRTFTK